MPTQQTDLASLTEPDAAVLGLDLSAALAKEATDDTSAAVRPNASIAALDDALSEKDAAGLTAALGGIGDPYFATLRRGAPGGYEVMPRRHQYLCVGSRHRASAGLSDGSTLRWRVRCLWAAAVRPDPGSRGVRAWQRSPSGNAPRREQAAEFVIQ
jgi:hypothetical protein